MNKKSANRKLHKQSQRRLKPAYAAVLLAFAVQTAQANPTGGSVVNGSASFATSGNTLTVTNTPGTIINWQGFSINSNEITNFAQQSASSTVLNRVVGNDPSSILGTLRSNGRVFLINRNGIVFGAGSVVDVAGLVASTLNLSDADFLAGRNRYTKGFGAGDISNAGNINANGDGTNGGQILLIAPNVKNTGVIKAPNGEILLAAGHSVDLVNTNDPNLRVHITAPAGNVTNVGQLIASSGSLGLFGTVVSNSGIVSADSATQQGGKIVFKATQRVDAGGIISAEGLGTAQGVSNSTVSGSSVGGSSNVGGLVGYGSGTISNSTVNTSSDITGSVGGLVGLNNGTVVNNSVNNVAVAVHGMKAISRVATGGVISAQPLASAQGTGGGTISLLANKLNGTVNVTGTVDVSAPVSGNGGVIETSAANVRVADSAHVTMAAPSGKAGTWLIDPTDFTIAIGSGLLTTSGIGSVTLAASLASGNVTIQTSASGTGNGDIFVNDPVSWLLHTLTLSASRNIYINANLNGSVAARLALEYGQGAVAAGNTANYYLNNGAQVNLPSGLNFSTKLGSDGSVTNYTVITSLGAAGSITAADLQGINGDLTGNYVLGSDIDASLTSSWNSGLGFVQLGNSSTKFTGQFDGLGHTISNLYINRPSESYVGLFGFVASGSSLNNIKLVDASVVGYNYVGGLAGENDGKIKHGSTSTSTSVGNVSGNYYVGGLVGFNKGAITNSFADILVSAAFYGGSVSGNSDIGGLVGYNSGSISNSYVDKSTAAYGGTVSGSSDVGGLVGFNDTSGIISNSYANGNVVSGNTSLVGSAMGGLVGANNGTISNSYVSNGSVSGVRYIGGLTGQNYGTLTNSHYDISQVAIQGVTDTYVTLGGLYNSTDLNGQYSDWLTHSLSLNIANYTSLAGSGTSYTITSAQGMKDLLGFSDRVGYTFSLGADIDLTGYQNLYIPYLAANFNGKPNSVGYTISNLNLGQNFNDNQGLFGTIASTGTVSNVILTNASVTGYSNVGALAGLNQGTISGSHIDNSNTLGGSVSGTNEVGGLVGTNDGTISNSYIDNSHSTGGGSVSGSYEVGGLVGYNKGTINTSYVNDIEAYGGTVSGTYYYVGGLVGYNNGTINTSYVDNTYVNNANGGLVSGGSSVGGLVGYNAAITSGNSVVRTSVGGIISSSYVNTGKVVGSSEVGGLVGSSWQGSISKSYVNGGTVTGFGSGNSIGGLVGRNNSAINSGKVISVHVQGVSYVGGLVGYNDGGEGGGNITGSNVSGGTVNGTSDVGGLVGHNRGSSNSYYHTVGGVISNSYVDTGTIVNGVTNVGGLVGNNQYGTINKGSYVSGGTVNGTTNVGGLVGMNYRGTIDNSYVSAGNVTGVSSVGGLVGKNGDKTTYLGNIYLYGGTISNSYVNTGTVVSGTTDIGGLVGANEGTATIGTSYVIGGTVNATGNDAGGLVGFNQSSVSNDHVEGVAVTGVNNVGGLVGLNIGGTGGVGGVGAVSSPGAIGATGSTTTISNSYVSGGTVNGSSNVGGLVGLNSIGLTGATGSGTNGGAGGLGGAAVISNTYVSGGTISVSSGGYVGGLVGNNSGNISTSYASGGSVIAGCTDCSGGAGGLVGYNSGTISTSFASNGSVAGAEYNGGLVGQNAGTISDTYASSVSVIGATTGSPGSYIYVGGLVGYNTGTINTSYASTGTLAGGGSIGGVVGYNDSAGGATVNNSFWNTTTAGSGVSFGIGYDTNASTGTNTPGKAYGMSDADMKTMANFTSVTTANGGSNPNWNISASGTTTTWGITEGVAMPWFIFFPPPALVPNVIDEIVDISDQNHKRVDDVLAGDVLPAGDGGNTLPMCN